MTDPTVSPDLDLDALKALAKNAAVWDDPSDLPDTQEPLVRINRLASAVRLLIDEVTRLRSKLASLRERRDEGSIVSETVRGLQPLHEHGRCQPQAPGTDVGARLMMRCGVWTKHDEHENGYTVVVSGGSPRRTFCDGGGL